MSIHERIKALAAASNKRSAPALTRAQLAELAKDDMLRAARKSVALAQTSSELASAVGAVATALKVCGFAGETEKQAEAVSINVTLAATDDDDSDDERLDEAAQPLTQ